MSIKKKFIKKKIVKLKIYNENNKSWCKNNFINIRALK